MRTIYRTFSEAKADGWRHVSHSTDRDTSGRNAFGCAYRSPDGQLSTTVVLTAERNRLGGPGCCAQMFRTTPEAEA